MVHFFKYTAMALIGLLLAACSSSPTPPPEPNMKKLVDVNKTYPAELYRADAATTESNNAEEKQTSSDIAGRSE